MTSDFASTFNAFVQNKYPSIAKLNLTIPENLISPYVMKQPKELLEQAREVAVACYRLRDSPSYQKSIEKSESIFGFDPKNYSLFMSFDFHIADGNLKLIEINTNAAFSLVAFELHNFQKLQNPQSLHHGFLSGLKKSFENEYKLSQPGSIGLPNVAIVDDNLPQQKMFVEFVIINDLLNDWGWKSAIGDINELHLKEGSLFLRDEPVQFVYNRSTNFALNGLDQLKEAYVRRKICLSPNPHEYFLLAEKSRAAKFHDETFLRGCGLQDRDIQVILKHVPFSKEVRTLSPEETWALRKSVFFKPKNAYAGKAVYKGAGITKKVFEQIRAGDFIAQEAITAPEVSVELRPGVKEDFKYDLRFYTYRDQILLSTARLYQGQVTNFRATGSGFTAVDFV
jgi:hypothetical protein